MRKYADEEGMIPVSVTCNHCGRAIKVENGIIREGFFSADYLFGYFSKKDGARHRFDLCEACYDKIAEAFAIPVEEIEEKELC